MSEQTKKEVREKFEINFEEHPSFNGIASTAYITSNELLKLTSELFKAVFADYEGAILELNNGGGEPTVSLLFNHGKYEENAIVACELANGKASGSAVIDRTRNRDRQMMEGDRYYITQDGKDVIETILTSRLYNNGNPNWKLLVGEYQERNMYTMYNYQAAPQYTKIGGISLARLCGLIYGTKEADDRFEYDVRITSPVTPYQMNGTTTTNYLLTITKVSTKEISKVYERLGFGPMNGNIIR